MKGIVFYYQNCTIRGPPVLSISSRQRNLMKTYHNEADTGEITKICIEIFFGVFGQSR